MMRGRPSTGLVGSEEELEAIEKRAWRRRGRRSSGGGGDGGPCGACKFLRRKCMRGCVFAPYFGADEEGREGFSAVHKVFGASNVSKLLQQIPHPDQRHHALITLQYQAHARLLDPIYGCLRTIFALKRQVENLQAELNYVRAELMYSQQQEVLIRNEFLLQHELEMNEYLPAFNDAQYQKQLCRAKEDGACNLIEMSMSLDDNCSDAPLHIDQLFEHPPFSNTFSLQDSHLQRLNILEFLVTQDFTHELPH